MPKAEKETLAQFVTRTIVEKGLKQHEVKQLSGGRITDGYVRDIMSGKASNLSVDKLKALAQGLGVPEEQIFRIARGLPIEADRESQEEESNYQLILDLMIEVRKSRSLADLLREVLKLPVASQDEAVRLLRYLNSRKRGVSQSRRNV